MTAAYVHSCARCGVVLGVPTDAVVAAHAERCFVVGDRVRSMGFHKVEGVIAHVIAAGCFSVRVAGDVPNGYIGYTPGSYMAFGESILRRVDLPAIVPVQPAPPNPMLYDGLTAEQCFERFTAQQHEAPSGWRIRWRDVSGNTGTGDIHSTAADASYSAGILREQAPRIIYTVEPSTLTADQMTAARSLWTARLRARHVAACEVERTQVVLDQDADDLPWR